VANKNDTASNAKKGGTQKSMTSFFTKKWNKNLTYLYGRPFCFSKFSYLLWRRGKTY
jgi:hypothetical protein